MNAGDHPIGARRPLGSGNHSTHDMSVFELVRDCCRIGIIEHRDISGTGSASASARYLGLRETPQELIDPCANSRKQVRIVPALPIHVNEHDKERRDRRIHENRPEDNDYTNPKQYVQCSVQPPNCPPFMFHEVSLSSCNQFERGIKVSHRPVRTLVPISPRPNLTRPDPLENLPERRYALDARYEDGVVSSSSGPSPNASNLLRIPASRPLADRARGQPLPALYLQLQPPLARRRRLRGLSRGAVGWSH